MFEGYLHPGADWVAQQEQPDLVRQPDPLGMCLPIPDPTLGAIQAADEPSAAVGLQQPGDTRAEIVADSEMALSAEKFLRALEPSDSPEEVGNQLDAAHSRANRFVREELEIPEKPEHRPLVDVGWFEELRELNRQTKPTELPKFDQQFLPRRPYDPSRMRSPRFSGRFRIPSFAKVFQHKCRQCGSEVKDSHCQNCGQEYCTECGLALEDGRCPDGSCISHRAAVCAGCGEKECRCES